MKIMIHDNRVFSVLISNHSGRPLERMDRFSEGEIQSWVATYNSLPYRGRTASVVGPEPKAR